jgi:hypothetical protein
MTTVTGPAGPTSVPAASDDRDRRGSWVPTARMVATRFMELRRRRGLMVTLIAVTIGIPTVFLTVRLVAHAIAPDTYGPAGGYDIYTAMSAGVLYVFGFVVAATLGCTAGSSDLADGMFRHLVITGRSRVALYLARIPAGLAIIVPLVAIGFAVVCFVSVAAAPTHFTYNGVAVPAGLSPAQLQSWAAEHPTTVLCDFDYKYAPHNVGCKPRSPGQVAQVVAQSPSGALVPASPTQARDAAIQIAQQNYSGYAAQFLDPPPSLMIKTGLWLELEATIGFIVGLGLGSLLGQRTVAVVAMIVLEIILTPIVIRAHLPHMINLQRGVVGVATAHLEPGALPLAFGGGGQDYRVTETTTTAVLVILAWIVIWTALGAWRMTRRDA